MAEMFRIARFFGSTSARLSRRFAILYAIITALVFGLSYHFADREMSDWVSEQLADDAAGFARLYEREGMTPTLEKLTGFAGFNFEDYRIYLLEGPDGTVLAGNIDAIELPLDGNYVPIENIRAETPRYREVSGYLVQTVQLGPNRLVLGTSTFFLEELREVLGRGFIAGFILLLLSGLAAGVVVGQRTERRMTRITSTLRSVAAGQLDMRVAGGRGDAHDIARLNDEINRTIAQLQKMVESQKQISADIAHDLRTPMQRLRQRLDALRDMPGLPPESEVAINDAAAIADDLIDTFHALLRIAEIEAGQRAGRFETVPLAPLLERIEDAYGAVAEENGQHLAVSFTDRDAAISGDRQLLTQMLANLVENALRHCPAGTRIELTLSRQAGQVTLTVADNGPGIPDAEREKVLRRFYRLEKSRTTPGNGLGLSMVKAIADLHGASMQFMDNAPGLKVVIGFSPSRLMAPAPEPSGSSHPPA